MASALARQRKLRALRLIAEAQDSPDIGRVFEALDEARVAGLDDRKLELAQQHLERLLTMREPQARVSLLLALETTERGRLVAAVEEARLCGVDDRLLNQATAVLAGLEEEPDVWALEDGTH